MAYGETASSTKCSDGHVKTVHCESWTTRSAAPLGPACWRKLQACYSPKIREIYIRTSMNNVGYTIWQAAATLLVMNGRNRSSPTIHTARTKRFKPSNQRALQNSEHQPLARSFQRWTAPVLKKHLDCNYLHGIVP